MSSSRTPAGPPAVTRQRSPRFVAWSGVLAVVTAVVVWVTGTWILDVSSIGHGAGLFAPAWFARDVPASR